MAATAAACQRIWLRNVLGQITSEYIGPITLYIENMPAIDLAKNHVFNGKSKHINIRYHFIRECVEHGEVIVKHVCTKPYVLYWLGREYRQGVVGDILEKKDERGVEDKIWSDLELNQIIGRKVSSLSPSELQRFAIGLIALQKAQVYVFNLPSHHLDVKQRLKAAQVI
ncbi:hypothetical protein AgCh_018722 [Apium graveolens]